MWPAGSAVGLVFRYITVACWFSCWFGLQEYNWPAGSAVGLVIRNISGLLVQLLVLSSGI